TKNFFEKLFSPERSDRREARSEREGEAYAEVVLGVLDRRLGDRRIGRARAGERRAPMHELIARDEPGAAAELIADARADASAGPEPGTAEIDRRLDRRAERSIELDLGREVLGERKRHDGAERSAVRLIRNELNVRRSRERGIHREQRERIAELGD